MHCVRFRREGGGEVGSVDGEVGELGGRRVVGEEGDGVGVGALGRGGVQAKDTLLDKAA